MTVKLEQIQVGFAKYIDNELGAKATGLTKFMVYFATPSIQNMLKVKINEYRSNPLFSDMFDDKGDIKLEDTYKRAKEAISKSGKILIPQINYFADEQDLELLFNYIKNA